MVLEALVEKEAEVVEESSWEESAREARVIIEDTKKKIDELYRDLSYGYPLWVFIIGVLLFYDTPGWIRVIMGFSVIVGATSLAMFHYAIRLSRNLIRECNQYLENTER